MVMPDGSGVTATLPGLAEERRSTTKIPVPTATKATPPTRHPMPRPTSVFQFAVLGSYPTVPLLSTSDWYLLRFERPSATKPPPTTPAATPAAASAIAAIRAALTRDAAPAGHRHFARPLAPSGA